MKYSVMSATNISYLTDIISRCLSKGWICQGGPFTSHNEIHQAMVLHDIIATETTCKDDELNKLDYCPDGSYRGWILSDSYESVVLSASRLSEHSGNRVLTFFGAPTILSGLPADVWVQLYYYV